MSNVLTTTQLRPGTVRRAAPWIPLVGILVVLAVGWWTASAPVDTARGATSASVPIAGTVGSTVTIDTTGCTAGSAVIGDILPGDPWKTAQDQGSAVCALGFSTPNDLLGADLTILEDPAAPPVPADAMKCTTGACAGDALTDYQGVGEPAAGTSAFGAQLVSTGGIASGVWSSGAAVYDVQDTGDTACQTAAIGPGTCSFTWGASAAAGDIPGAYQAAVQAVVLAR